MRIILQVRSYLAVPVISSSGQVLGGLFFGHPEPGIFSQREEDLVRALASHAAIAIDNARLFKKSEEAVRARDEFLSIASHELKTPLTSLKLQSQLLQRSIQKNDPHAYSKARIDLLSEQTERQVNRLSRLIDDMLDISRIRTGQLTIEREDLDFGDLARDLIGRIRVQFSAAKVELALQVAEGPMLGHWDRIRMEQVMTNLLTNALRYGNGKPVQVRVEQASDAVRMAVQDHGIGIELSQQGRIFDRFERGVNANETSGLGLGLFITKQIVTAHGGKVWVESQPGRGSTFYVELPSRPEVNF